MHKRRIGLWGVVGLCLACKEAPKPLPPLVVDPPPPRAPIVGPRATATRASFDLVHTTDGAALIWGPPSQSGGGVHVVALNRAGGIVGNEKQIPRAEKKRAQAPIEELPPDSVEIAAASGSGRLGIAWVSRQQTVLRVESAVGDDRGETFGPPMDLGTTEAGTVGHRGQVAVAASTSGDLQVLYRSMPGPCGDAKGPRCSRFLGIRLGGSPGASSRKEVPMTVPSPCVGGLVGYVSNENVWYSGICSEGDGKRTITLYSVRLDTEYAQAEELLSECVPLGIAPLPDSIAVAGNCKGALEIVRLSTDEKKRSTFSSVQPSVVCKDNRPVLVLRGDNTIYEQPFTASMSRIEVLLPENIAPVGARAVWTGEAILVALPAEHEVLIRRFQCEHGDFMRTDSR